MSAAHVVDLVAIAARVAASKTYDFTVPQVNVGDFKHDDLGVTQRVRLEYVPISDVNVPAPWSDDKLQAVKADMDAGKKLEPVRLTMPDGKGKWEIDDGIHRTNAAREAGYSHVPAITTEYVPFGEEPKARLVDPI